MTSKKQASKKRETEGRSLEIVGSSGIAVRGVGRGRISAETLKERLNDFLTTLQDIVKGTPGTIGDFNLDTVTLTAEVNAKGQISLLGTGGELGGKGGITFTLKRNKPGQPPATP